jgi:hypothetical protein
MPLQVKKVIGSSISVALISKPNSLSLALANKILDKNLELIVLDEDLDIWEDQIERKEIITFVTKSELKKVVCGYVVYINLKEHADSKETKELQRDVEIVIKIARDNFAKAVFFFPVLQEDLLFKTTSLLKNKILNEEDVQSNIFFIGSLIDSAFENNTLLERLFAELHGASFVSIPKDLRKIYFSDTKNVVDEAVKALFGFGIKGNELSIISKPFFVGGLIEFLKSIKVDFGIKYVNRKYDCRKTKNKIILKTNYKRDLRNMFERSGKYPLESKVAELSKTKKIHKRSKDNPQKMKRVLFSQTLQNISTKRCLAVFAVLFVFIISPYLLLLSSVLLLYSSFQIFSDGNTSLTRKTLEISENLFGLSEKQFGIYSKLPLVGNSFSGSKNTSRLLKEISMVGNEMVDITKDIHELGFNIKDKKPYDAGYYSKDLSDRIEYVYQKSGFIFTDLAENKLFKYFMNRKGIELSDLLEVRRKAYEITNVIDELPDILADGSSKNYMILFQNNMELRPAGGFIGSFAIVGFENGYLRETKIYDVYDADGQLKGYVDPPDAIHRYLNSSGWYLRDSNWDPDFPKSAKTAEWFLEKEMGIKVDGVVAVDLEFLKKLISDYGEIEIADYDITINEDNFYQTIQSQVENNFFPGSKKKSNLLTALTNELLDEMFGSRSVLSFTFVKNLYLSLEERNIQVFLHNQKAQAAIDKNNWSGSLRPINCGDNCIVDYVSEVEANFGVNKVNYFVERNMKLSVNVDEESIKRELIINLKNTADEEFDNFPWYKVYVRVLTHKDADFGPVVSEIDGEISLLEPDINTKNEAKEAGVYVEVFPQEEAFIKFTWESKHDLRFDKEGQFISVVRKQAGTQADPLLVNLEFDTVNTFLTENNKYIYNTNLARDKVFRISW